MSKGIQCGVLGFEVFKKKGKGSQYSITECRVPELIQVLSSQPAGDVSHKPDGRLPLLSARPAVTLATLKRAVTNFAAWWTEAQCVWTVCVRLLPDSVATAIWTLPFCTWVQHANHSANEKPSRGFYQNAINSFIKELHILQTNAKPTYRQAGVTNMQSL